MGFFSDNMKKRYSSVIVRPKFLIHYGIPESTIYNSITKYRHDMTVWDTTEFGDTLEESWIFYHSIPQSIKEKYDLPREIELIDILKVEKREKYKSTFRQHVNYLRGVISVRYSHWDEFIPVYQKLLPKYDDVEKHCKTHAIFKACIELHDSDFTYVELFEVFREYDDLVIKASNSTSFSNRLKNIRRSGSIESGIMHGHRNKSGNALKIEKDVKKLILRFLSDPKKLNGRQIQEKVNDLLVKQNRKTISLSYVRTIIGNEISKNEVIEERYGRKYAEENLYPHAYFTVPGKPGQLWGIDGTRCQFVYRTKKKKWNFLYIFVVLDVMSKKVVGYAFGETEDTEIIISALKMACEKTKILPKHILHDNSSALNSKEMMEIKTKMKLMGVSWRAIRVGNSRDNGAIERFFGVFQESYCKPIDGYLGDGITSKNLDGKPSPEELKKIVQGKISRTRSELIEVLSSLINKYNSSQENNSNMEDLSDENSEPAYAKALNTISFIQLFWELKVITVRKSTVIFQVNNRQYIYVIYDEKFMCSYRNKKVMVRYDKKNLDVIYIFTMKDIYLRTVERFIPIPKLPEDRTSQDNKRLSLHNKKVKELRSKMKSRFDELISETDMYLDNQPVEIAAFSHATKIDKEKAEDAYFNENEQEINEVDREESRTSSKDNIIRKMNNLYKEKGNLKIV